MLRLLYGPALTSIHDNWKYHSFGYIDLCWQSDVFAFNTLTRFVIAFLPRTLHCGRGGPRLLDDCPDYLPWYHLRSRRGTCWPSTARGMWMWMSDWVSLILDPHLTRRLTTTTLIGKSHRKPRVGIRVKVSQRTGTDISRAKRKSTGWGNKTKQNSARYIIIQFWGDLGSFFACSVSQPCLTLRNTTDCSPPGSSVHGISQAWILEGVAISFSRGSSWHRDQTSLLCLPHWQTNSLPRSHLGSLECLLICKYFRWLWLLKKCSERKWNNS